MISEPIGPREVVALVGSLDRLGVSYPPEVATGVSNVTALSDGSLVAAAESQAVPSLVGCTTAELLQHARQLAITRQLMDRDRHRESLIVLADALCLQLIDVLTSAAEDVLDQLRPRFERAAQAVTEALEAGIRPGMTAEQVIALGQDHAVECWRALPAHIAALDEIAAMRCAMSRVLDLAPRPDRWNGSRRRTGLAFGLLPSWQQTPGRGTSGTDHWLRLCGIAPVSLLTLQETERLAAGNPSTPRLLVPAAGELSD